MPEPGYIDLHHHVLPGFYRDELIARRPAATKTADEILAKATGGQRTSFTRH